MMGRIGDVVREKSGLAYYAYSSLSAGTGPGSWEVSAGVNPQNVKKAAGLIQDELKRFVQEGVTDESWPTARRITSGVCRFRWNPMGAWQMPC